MSPPVRSKVAYSLRALLLGLSAFAILLAGVVTWGAVAISVASGIIGTLVFIAGSWKDRPGLVVVGILVVACGVPLPLMRGARWIGHGTFVVPFFIMDESTGEPVPNASVKVRDLPTSREWWGITDEAGRVRLSLSITVMGSRDFLRETSTIQVSDLEVVIDAKGRVPIRENLGDHISADWDASKSDLPRITIGLDRVSPTAQASKSVD